MDRKELPAGDQDRQDEEGTGSGVTYQTLPPDGQGVVDFGQYRQDVLALYADLFPSSSTSAEDLKDLEEDLGKDGTSYILALTNDRVVGFSSIGASEYDKSRERVGIQASYVSLDYRRNHIFTKLTQESIRLAREAQAKSLYVLPLNKKQEFQFDFLRRQGFVETQDKLGPNDQENETLYVLELDDQNKS